MFIVRPFRDACFIAPVLLASDAQSNRVPRGPSRALSAPFLDEADSLPGYGRGHLAEVLVNELMAPFTVPALFCATT